MPEIVTNDGTDPDNVEAQPAREDSRCPECGGEPIAEAVIHRLSDLGYAHDDQRYQCRDCGNKWDCGVPIGEFDRPEMAAELWCDSCDGTSMLVHRVVVGNSPISGDVVLHLKCPNPECHHFTRIGRDTDDDGRALVGHPEITGETEGARPYGYVRDSTDDSTDGTADQEG